MSRWFPRRRDCAQLRNGVLLLMLAWANPLAAQDTTPATLRPYQGLFAGGNPNPNHELALTYSLFAVRDDNVTDGTRSYDPLYQVSGVYGDAITALTYTDRGTRGFLTASGGASGRYYTDLRELSQFGGNGSLDFSYTFGNKSRRSTTISGFESAAYEPYYTLNLLNTAPSQPPLGGGSVAPKTGDALTSLSSHEYDGTVKVVETWGLKSSLDLSYDYRHTVLGQSPDPFVWQLANASFVQKITSFTGLRLGYGYGQASGTTPNAPVTTNQNIDVGLDYSRPLSPTRRTAFGFTTGSSIITNLGVSYYRLVIDGNVSREIGRTWKAGLTYHRGLQFVEGIAVPLYADTVQARVGGLVTKRYDLAFTGGYSGGQIGLSAVNSGYITYSGTTDLHIAVSRTLSLAMQYQYYRYDFDQAAVVPAGISPILHRQSVRIGVSGWLGLLR